MLGNFRSARSAGINRGLTSKNSSSFFNHNNVPHLLTQPHHRSHTLSSLLVNIVKALAMRSFAIHVLSLGFLTANLSFASPVPDFENKLNAGAVTANGDDLHNNVIAGVSGTEAEIENWRYPYPRPKGQGFPWKVKKWQCRPDSSLSLANEGGTHTEDVVKKDEAVAEPKPDPDPDREGWPWHSGSRYRPKHPWVVQKWRCPPGSPLKLARKDNIEAPDIVKKDELVVDPDLEPEMDGRCFWVRETWGTGFRWKGRCPHSGPSKLARKDADDHDLEPEMKWLCHPPRDIPSSLAPRIWICPPGGPPHTKKDELVADPDLEMEMKWKCHPRRAVGSLKPRIWICPPGGPPHKKDELVTDSGLEPEMKANCHKEGHPFLVRRFSCETDQDVVKKDGLVTSTTFDVPVGKDKLSLSSFHALLGRRQLIDPALQDLANKSCARDIAAQYEPANFDTLSTAEIETLVEDTVMCWFGTSISTDDISGHQVTEAAHCSWDLINDAYYRADLEGLAELDKDIWWMVHTHCLKYSAEVQQPMEG